MADGEQFVMMVGISTLLVLSADSSVFQMQKVLTRVVTLVGGLDQFFLTIFVVQVLSHRYFHALIREPEHTTVIILKTRGYAVTILEVRMNDKKFKHVQKVQETTKLPTSDAESLVPFILDLLLQ